MTRTIRTFGKVLHGYVHRADAYVDDKGIWRWASNDAVVPVDAAAEYAIPVDQAAQRAAKDQETAAFVREYRKAQRNRKPSAEELFEMRAAFGTGTTVVNVLTGRRTRL